MGGPLETNGLFRESLVQVLSLLQKSPEVILAALEIFVSEPTLDWLEQARKEAASHKIDLSEKLENFPRERIDLAVQAGWWGKSLSDYLPGAEEGDEEGAADA